MPYIIHEMMNYQKIDPNKINAAERKILKRWWIDGHIVFLDKMWISRKFWDTIGGKMKETKEIIMKAYREVEVSKLWTHKRSGVQIWMAAHVVQGTLRYYLCKDGIQIPGIFNDFESVVLEYLARTREPGNRSCNQ